VSAVSARGRRGSPTSGRATALESRKRRAQLQQARLRRSLFSRPQVKPAKELDYEGRRGRVGSFAARRERMTRRRRRRRRRGEIISRLPLRLFARRKSIPTSTPYIRFQIIWWASLALGSITVCTVCARCHHFPPPPGSLSNSRRHAATGPHPSALRSQQRDTVNLTSDGSSNKPSFLPATSGKPNLQVHDF
jgi:hypothetical protein